MIQIDMPMPENCFECPACNEYRMCAIPVNGMGWGESHVREYKQSRPEWCPLKEQEAIKPITEHHLFLCPVCKNTLFREQKFCHECGKRIDWEGR